MAETLKLIASHGPHIFYNGTIADSLVEEIKTFNGIIKKEDLQKYRFVWTLDVHAQWGKIGNEFANDILIIE